MTAFWILLQRFCAMYKLRKTPSRLRAVCAGDRIHPVRDTSVPAFLYMLAQQLYAEHSKVARLLAPQGRSKRLHELRLPCRMEI